MLEGWIWSGLIGVSAAMLPFAMSWRNIWDGRIPVVNSTGCSSSSGNRLAVLLNRSPAAELLEDFVEG